MCFDYRILFNDSFVSEMLKKIYFYIILAGHKEKRFCQGPGGR
jgi:hypothetical protein